MSVQNELVRAWDWDLGWNSSDLLEWMIQEGEMVVQRGYNFGSLTQTGYLLVTVCRGRWVLTGGLWVWTGKKSSAELSPWSSPETGGLSLHER